MFEEKSDFTVDHHFAAQTANPDPCQGARRLWGSVLLDALNCVSSRNSLVRRAALFYFFESEETGPGSLRWICDALRLNIAWVKVSALKLSNAPTVQRSKKARAAGAVYAGRPCRVADHAVDGHTMRYRSSSICVQCQHERNSAGYRKGSSWGIERRKADRVGVGLAR